MLNKRIEELSDGWDVNISSEHAEYLKRDYKDDEVQKFGLLLPDCEIEGLDIDGVNDFLHYNHRYDPWPENLFAFATMGCGDYFAYYNVGDDTKIIYIDPDKTVADNLSSTDKMLFNSFNEWINYKKST